MLRKDYIQLIDKLKIDSDRIYVDVGVLRDQATNDEKEYFNRLRTLLREAYTEFDRLQTHIDKAKAKKQDRIS
jgi:hypothetical protein